MKPPRSIVAGLMAGASLFYISIAAAAAAETGMIGRRYAGPEFNYDHFSGSAVDKAFGAAAELNLPVGRVYDLNFGYSYADATGDNYDALEKRLTASLLTHRSTEYGTAYFAPSLGHAWRSADVLGVGSRQNGGFWGVRAGYEMPVGSRTAVDAGIGYVDDFERGNTSAQVLSYRVALNHWFSRDLAGITGLTYRQIKAAPDAIRYTLGLRWAF